MLSALFSGDNGNSNSGQNPPMFPSRQGATRGRGFSRERGRGRGRGRKNWNSKNGNNFNTDRTGYFANKAVDYADDKEKIKDFLINFTNEVEPFKYIRLMQLVANREVKVFKLYLDDMEKFFRDTDSRGLVRRIEGNTLHYKSIIESAIQSSLPEPSLVSRENFEEDVIDVLLKHRTERDAAARKLPPNPDVPFGGDGDDGDLGGGGLGGGEEEEEEDSPAYLEEFSKRFEVQIYPRTKTEQTPLRLVRANHIGKLVVVKGIVTRASDVKPLAKVVTYTCDQCQCEIYQTVPGKSFMPLFKCTSEVCRRNTNPGVLYMQTRGSKFVKFQEIRIQEPMEQVPIGHIPRCINVRLQGDLTHRCSPGDVVTICGIFLPTLQSAVKGEVNLVAETYVEALSIIHNNKGFSSFDISDEVKAEVDRVIESGENVYDKLARSIAPEIYGMDDVKKALLLQMVGMPTRRLADGMKIRGDINVLLMGDPGVAKSQLLKHVSSMAPRSVYTSGKGSTGVGLMAAVVKDPTTGEYVLEGGSLVLADMGICCIDEFDKMEDTDRTAIHEVMEQQTISIAKAGITTTLNARTAILAAANPSSGRYLVSRTPSENIGMPAALLSRFDLVFILLDIPEEVMDRAKADHIIAVHVEADSVNSGKHKKKKAAAKKKKAASAKKSYGDSASLGDGDLDLLSGTGDNGYGMGDDTEEEDGEGEKFEPYTTEFIRAYLMKVRNCIPTIPDDSNGYVVNAYVNMRKENQSGDNGDTYVSARTLLAIARLRFSKTVNNEDIDEAIRLMAATKESIAKRPRVSAQAIIRELNEKSNGAGVSYADVLVQMVHKGFSESQLRETIQEYESLGIITLSADSSVITFNDWC